MSLSADSARYLVFPMEIVEREMLGNALLGIEAVSRGWNVILGTKRAVFDAAPHLPESLVFLKSIMSCEIHNMRNLKRAGHKLACLDVEGLVYTSVNEFITTRFDPETVAELELAMFWGDIQRDAAAQAFPAQAHRFHTTGTPIVDLWRAPLHNLFRQEAESLRERYGKYIIIPSSFASVNHFMGADANRGILTRDEIIAKDKREEFFKFWDEYERYVRGIFQKFLALIPDVAKAFPDHKIIIRPHPSESHDLWKEAARRLPNVTIIFDGPVSPWLLGADAVLHWGCTTGVEAYLMGKPVIAYNPASAEEEAKFDHRVPHCISLIARTPAEVNNLLTEAITQPQDLYAHHPEIAVGEQYLRQWIRYADNAPAATQVISQLETVALASSRDIEKIPAPRIMLRERILRILDVVAAPPLIQNILPARMQLSLKSRAYGRHKTRSISYDRLNSHVQSLTTLRHLPAVKVSRIADGLYKLEKAA